MAGLTQNFKEVGVTLLFPPTRVKNTRRVKETAVFGVQKRTRPSPPTKTIFWKILPFQTRKSRQDEQLSANGESPSG